MFTHYSLLNVPLRNPKLGALVRSIKNHGMSSFEECKDATLDDDSQMVVRAAQNITCLSKASFAPNPLAAYIIANLQLYPQLVDLHVYGLKPQEHIWSNSPVSLTTLKWEVPTGRGRQNAWDRAQFLVDVVEATCPHLESLDISFVDSRGESPTLSATPQERTQLYRDLQATTTTRLTHLRHFGFSYRSSDSPIEEAFLNFVERHRESLRSISIPTSFRSYKRERLDFVLKVCLLLPALNELTLEETMTGSSGEDITSLHFFQELTTALASPKFSIECFSVGDVGTSFSPALGMLFRAWTSLKYLRVGDKDIKDSCWDNDGSPDFIGYKVVRRTCPTD